MRSMVVLCVVLWAAPTFAQGTDATIVCPPGATPLSVGTNLPSVIASAATGTVFCLAAGTHTPSATINMKTGQQLIGAYGAIIDGTNIPNVDDSTSIVRCWNATCSGVTLRNLVIQNGWNCIGIYNTNAGGWVVDHVEATGCTYGINVGFLSGLTVTNSLFHHNNNLSRPDYTGGYGGNVIQNARFEGNEFHHNGRTQKITGSTNVQWVNNYSHNEANAIWFDGENTGITIDGNRVEDTSETAIFYEISYAGTIHNNIVTRAADNGIFLSTSESVEVTGNTITDAFRGINMFVSCDRRHVTGQPAHDLTHDHASANMVILTSGATAGSWLADFGSINCTATDLAAYDNGSKDVWFQSNSYYVQDLSGQWWDWEDSLKTWAQWKALPYPQDTLSTLALTTALPPPSTTPPPPPPPPPPAPTDTVPPVTSVSVPSIVSRRSVVTIQATATDNVAVTSIQLSIDGVVVARGTSSVTYKWKVPAAIKPHTVTATAKDAAGNSGSGSVLVTTVR